MTFNKHTTSLGHAFKGFKIIWKEEHNFRLELVCAVIVLIAIWHFKFTYIESLFCIIAILLVLGAEIVNTAIENLCDKIEEEIHPIIGKVKDTMAAFVLLMAIGAFVIGILVFYHHFFIL